MKILAIDPDTKGGFAVVSVLQGQKPVVHRSGLTGTKTRDDNGRWYYEPCLPNVMFAMVKEERPDALVIEGVFTSFNKGNQLLMKLGFGWETIGEMILLPSQIHRINARHWRKLVGLPTTGSKSGASRAAKKIQEMIALAAENLVDCIDPKKKHLREECVCQFEDSEADAVCMAVAFAMERGYQWARKE